MNTGYGRKPCSPAWPPTRSTCSCTPTRSGGRAPEQWYLGVVDLAGRVGARGAGGHVSTMSVPDWADEARRAERWAGLQHSLAAIAAAARSAGLDYLLVENPACYPEP